MTFKAIILLKRKEELSRQDFINWWLGTHKPLALQLPGLKKMCINISQNDDAEYDGASELWFDSEAEFVSAYATPLGQRVAADSLSMVSRRNRLFVDEIILQPSSGQGTNVE